MPWVTPASNSGSAQIGIGIRVPSARTNASSGAATPPNVSVARSGR